MNYKTTKSSQKIAGYCNLGNKHNKQLQNIPQLRDSLLLDSGAVVSDYPFIQIRGYNICIAGKILSVLNNDYQLSDYDDNPAELVAELFCKYGPSFQQLLDGVFIILLHDEDVEDWLLTRAVYSSEL